MRQAIQLAALFTAFAAAMAHAQISDPNKLVAPAPPNPARHFEHRSHTDVQWLWKYTQPAPHGDEGSLMVDPRFAALLHDQLRAPQAFFRDGQAPLDEVAMRYLGVMNGDVRGENNRYITLSGCVPHDCVDQGLLFIDTLGTHPLVVFAATEWTATGKSSSDPNAEYNLWLFPGATLDPEHPPAALERAIAHWNATNAEHIQTAILVDPDGTPHKLDPSVYGAISSTTNPKESTR